MKLSLATASVVAALLAVRCAAPKGSESRSARGSSKQAPLDVVINTRQGFVAFATDATGDRALTAGDDNSIKLWDLRSGLQVRTYSGHTDTVSNVAFAPDGKRFASTSQDMTAKIWDLESGQVLRTLPHEDWVMSVAFHPNGEEIATGDWSGHVQVWPGSGDVPDRTLSLPSRPCDRVRYTGSPARLRAEAYGTDGVGAIRIWDSATGELEREFSHYSDDPLELSESGDLLAFEPDGVEVHDGASGELLYTKESRAPVDYEELAISPDSRYLAALLVDREGPLLNQPARFDVWEAASGEPLHTLEAPGLNGLTMSFAFTSDGSRLVAADPHDIYVWSLATGKLLTHIDPQGHWLRSVAISPSGRRVAIAAEKVVKLFDLASARGVRNLEGHTSDVVATDFSPDGRLLLSGGQDGEIRLWSAATGQLRAVLKTDRPVAVYQAWFTADSRRIIARMTNSLFLTWNVATASIESETEFESPWGAPSAHPLPRFMRAWQGASAMSADGTLVALGGGGGTFNTPSLALFDAKTGKKRFDLEGHDSTIQAVAFSPDGGTLVSAGTDTRVHLYDTRTGKLRARLTEHSAEVSQVAFSDDGKTLVSAGYDGRAILWDWKTLEPRASLVPIGQDDWAILLPDLNYCASRGALTAIGFRDGVEVRPFEQYDLVYNRPDLVAQALGHSTPALIELYAAAHRKRIEKMDLGGQLQARVGEAPSIEILSRASIPQETEASSLSLKVHASAARTPIDRIHVWVNGVPALTRDGLKLAPTLSVERELELELSPGPNKLEVSARNSAGIESLRQTVHVSCAGPRTEAELYVVAIGVSRYADPAFDLEYASKDARDLVEAFTRDPRPFRGVKSVLLLDQRATLDGLQEARSLLEETQVQDTVIVLYAGHGLLDSNLDYFLGTHDMDFMQPAAKGLSYDALEGLLDGIRARQKVLLIDACHSGEIDKQEEGTFLVQETNSGKVTGRGLQVSGKVRKTVNNKLTFDLMRELFADLRRGTGAVVIASAAGSEFALESDKWSNGVFTYALLDGLQLGADLDRDGRVLISELRDYVTTRVPALTGGLQTPTARHENLEVDFPIH